MGAGVQCVEEIPNIVGHIIGKYSSLIKDKAFKVAIQEEFEYCQHKEMINTQLHDLKITHTYA